MKKGELKAQLTVRIYEVDQEILAMFRQMKSAGGLDEVSDNVLAKSALKAHAKKVLQESGVLVSSKGKKQPSEELKKTMLRLKK